MTLSSLVGCLCGVVSEFVSVGVCSSAAASSCQNSFKRGAHAIFLLKMFIS